MKDILLEVGFDWHAGNLGPALTDEHGPILRNPSYRLFPLQFGLVHRRHGKGHPLWTTQLETEDRIQIRIFDIGRQPSGHASLPRPVRFEAHFQNCAQPTVAEPLFRHAEVPILVGDAEAAQLAAERRRSSYVFGFPEAQKGIARTFRSWDVVTRGGEPCVFELDVKPQGIRLQRALMALALRAEGVGSNQNLDVRDYALDPEVYVGPYGNDTSGIHPQEERRVAAMR